MLTDMNKGVTTDITYNHMNLPVTIVINDGTNIGTITYLYNAAVIKLKKTVTPNGGSAVVTDYLSGYQHKDGVNDTFIKGKQYVGFPVFDFIFVFNKTADDK